MYIYIFVVIGCVFDLSFVCVYLSYAFDFIAYIYRRLFAYK